MFMEQYAGRDVPYLMHAPIYDTLIVTELLNERESL